MAQKPWYENEREAVLRLAGVAVDDPSISLADLRKRTGYGADVHEAAYPGPDEFNDAVIAGQINDPGSDTNAALASAFDSALTKRLETVLPSRSSGNTVALIGDSITWRTAPKFYVAGSFTTANGWLNWANAATGRRLKVVASFAVSGKRTDEMLSEQLPQVLALDPLPSWVAVLGGANDLIQGRTNGQIQNDLATIYNTLLRAGIRVFAGTVTPMTGLSPTQTQRLYDVNRWIRSYAAATSGVHLVDWFSQLVNSSGYPASDILTDNVHPTTRAACIMGSVFADVVNQVVPPLDLLPLPGDTANVMPNPMKNDAGQGYIDSTQSSLVAYNYRVASADEGAYTAVPSKVTRDDGIPGLKQRIEITSGNVRLTNASVVPASPGQTWQATAEVFLSPDAAASATRVSLVLAQSGGTSTQGMDLDVDPDVPDGMGAVLGAVPERLVLQTPPVTLRTGATGIFVTVRFYGVTGGYVEVGRQSLMRVTPP